MQERTLADRYLFMCTKFDIVNHDGFLISGVVEALNIKYLDSGLWTGLRTGVDSF